MKMPQIFWHFEVQILAIELEMKLTPDQHQIRGILTFILKHSLRVPSWKGTAATC